MDCDSRGRATPFENRKTFRQSLFPDGRISIPMSTISVSLRHAISEDPFPIASLYLLREQQGEVPENVMRPAANRWATDESVVTSGFPEISEIHSDLI